MSSKISYSQKSVFLYKPGNPRVHLRDAHIRERLAAAQPEERDETLRAQRLSKFLETREIIEETTRKLYERYLRETLDELSEFVQREHPDGRLPTSILLRADVKAYVAKIKEAQPKWHIISIHSKECPNFKSTIKLIVNRFTEKDSHVVSDRRLTYDFNVLIGWLQATSADPRAERLLVVVEDADGFDFEIIRELISHMHSYVHADELRLHLLLNISVPLPLIEENLSQSNVVSMSLQILQGLPPVTSFINDCVDALANSPNLRLVLSKALIEKLFVTDTLQAAKHLQYAILGHFAGNPLASINSVRQLSDMRALVEKLPSVHINLTTDPKYLDNLLSSDIEFEQLHSIVPELQVGGAVLDIAFDPNYRPLIEQALTDPRIYVPSLENADRMSVPSTVLYQLTRESSIYINIYDFYCAFKEMVRPVPGCADWDRQSVAIFLETITSLKMMGILRDCKRKFECVEKVSWKGV